MDSIWHKRLEALSGQYDWVADMYGVPQNPVYHAEGDVATHTQMVIDALTSLQPYREMPAEHQQVLWMSALLHDVEKRSTTFMNHEGAVVSPGHARKGAATARRIIMQQFQLPFHEREKIVSLVKHHGLPLWLMDKHDPQLNLIQASFTVSMAWLHLLATADVLGRHCADKAALLEKLEFFKAYCMEQQVWNQPYPFASEAARFHYCNVSQQSSPQYQPFIKYSNTATIVCGLPGMGKDYFIQHRLTNTPVISLDEIRRAQRIQPTDRSGNGRVVQQAKEQAKQYLRTQTDFVWNATCITRPMRSQLISLFSSYGARIRIVYIERPYQRWLLQNRQRPHPVPAAVMEKMLHKLEVPERTEAHDVEYITV